MHELSNCPVCSGKVQNTFLTSSDYFLSGENFTIVRCPDCGFLYTNPRPEEDQLAAYYQSTAYVSHSNTRKGLINKLYQVVRNYSLTGKVSLVSRYKKQGTVLDIGCGTGHFLNRLRQKGFDVIGIEPEKTAREYGAEIFNLDVYPDIHQLPGNSKFDAITLWHVLEHVFDLNEYLHLIKEHLFADGIVLIAVPNPDSFDARHYGRYWAAWDLPRHLYHFTKNSMHKFSEKHGFKIDAIVPMKFDSYYVSMLSEKYKNGNNNFLKAFYSGFISNRKAKRQKDNYSSLIYILKRIN